MSISSTKKPSLFKMSLTNQILIATIGGIVFGSIVGPWAGNIKFIGDIFIRLIQMSVVLLVMTSVAAAIGNVDGKSAGRMGFHTFKWIIIMTTFASLLGLALAVIIKPGIGIEITNGVLAAEPVQASIKDTILGFFTTNIISSMASGAMIPSIIFALLFGMGMGTYTRTSGKTVVKDFIVGFNAVIMEIIKMVMKLAPIGIFALLAAVSGTTGFKVIIPMLKFLGALAIGDVIQLMVFGPLTGVL